MQNRNKDKLSRQMGQIAHKISLKKGMQKDFLRKLNNASSLEQKEYFQKRYEEVGAEIQQMRSEYEAVKEQIKQQKSEGLESSGFQM